MPWGVTIYGIPLAHQGSLHGLHPSRLGGSITSEYSQATKETELPITAERAHIFPADRTSFCSSFAQSIPAVAQALITLKIYIFGSRSGSKMSPARVSCSLIDRLLAPRHLVYHFPQR